MGIPRWLASICLSECKIPTWTPGVIMSRLGFAQNQNIFILVTLSDTSHYCRIIIKLMEVAGFWSLYTVKRKETGRSPAGHLCCWPYCPPHKTAGTHSVVWQSDSWQSRWLRTHNYLHRCQFKKQYGLSEGAEGEASGSHLSHRAH